MSFGSSPAFRRVAQVAGTGAAAALITAGLAGTASAAPIESGAFDCAPLSLSDARAPGIVAPEGKLIKDRLSHYPTAEERAAAEADFKLRKTQLGLDGLEIRDPVVIEVAWHVIREGGTVEEGNISRKQIRSQIKVLNHAYRGHGEGEPSVRTPFKFKLAEGPVSRTTNPEWFNNADQPAVEREMKEATRVGDAETLNSWSTNLLNVGLLGYATFPSDYEANPELDGVVNTFQSLPGGEGAEPYNLGDTATHEIGHWLGLYHTFEGGCSDGDGVEDTPAEAEPYFGDCPPGTESDTCTGDPGNDPIENFMDYSDDICMDRFTIGQRERAYEMWFTYRDGQSPVS
jgi:hypothetical protein